MKILQCPVGEYRYIDTLGGNGSRHALFVGVSLSEFEYQRMREFSTKVLDILIFEAPESKHVTMAIDRSFGLDEVECMFLNLPGSMMHSERAGCRHPLKRSQL